MKLFRYVGSAIKHPAETRAPSLLRCLLAQPVLFDVASAVLQWRDVSRVERADHAYLSEDPEVKKTHDHNLNQIRRFTRTRRAEPYYQALTANLPDIKSKKLLIVGGRSIQEFALAWTFGFRWQNMIGIDLFSTNKKILPMNMEEMSFPDETFDLVTAINVLGYTSGIEKGLRECARVLKPHGRFVFDHTYRPDDVEHPVMKLKGREVAHILEAASLEIYFHNAKDKVTRGLDKQTQRGFRQTAHIFGCRKIPPDEEQLDLYRAY